MRLYRHGDLLIKEVNSIPIGAKKKQDNVLAYGEVTGHKHLLKAKQQVVLDVNGQTYIELEKPTELVHEEHKTLVIDAGLYSVIHEREFNPFEEVIRQVMD